MDAILSTSRQQHLRVSTNTVFGQYLPKNRFELGSELKHIFLRMASLILGDELSHLAAWQQGREARISATKVLEGE